MIHFTSSDEDFKQYLKQSNDFDAICKGAEGRMAITVDGVVFYVFREARALCLALAFQEIKFDYYKVVEPFMCRFAIMMKSISQLDVLSV